MLHKNKGSMLITAIFVIVVFTILIAVMFRMVSDTRQANISSVYATKAENLAQGAAEMTLSMLFEHGKENAANSSLWAQLESAASPHPVNMKTYEVMNCDRDDMKGKEPFCNDSRCKVKSVKITPYSTGHSTDTTVVYEVVASASCQVPWVDHASSATTQYYPVERTVRLQVSDVRWYNVDAIKKK